jgi:hypothetical protein
MSKPFWIYRPARLLTTLGLLVLFTCLTAYAADAKSKAAGDYDAVRERYADDVEGNWALAEWCKEHKLHDRRTEHLRRVLELDPDHAAARRALGYSRIGGQWLTREQFMTARGYVRHRGRWVLPQEKVLLESRETQSAATKQWMRKIKLWLSYSHDERPDLQARGQANLRGIDDAAALEALNEILGEHEDERYRLLMVEILANIDDPKVTSQLVARSLTDPSVEVRSTAIELVVEGGGPDAMEKYKRALHSDENQVVRRAAAALGQFNDVAVVPALIEALVTEHKVAIPDRGASGLGFTNTTVAPRGDTVGPLPGGASGPFVIPSRSGFGLGYGGGRPTKALVEIRNSEALFALNKLTSKNFGYDKGTWRLYWESQQRQNAGAPVLQP